MHLEDGRIFLLDFGTRGPSRATILCDARLERLQVGRYVPAEMLFAGMQDAETQISAHAGLTIVAKECLPLARGDIIEVAFDLAAHSGGKVRR